jgi:BirA family biotin operon repressor/biotin-[acetyl-CoA-carboxylase] ligase
MLHPTILRFDSIDSTNLEAIRQVKLGAPEGLCVVAREQTAGRGRLDRAWHSLKDAGLYFSLVMRPQIAMTEWPLLTLMAALAVSDALWKACAVRVDIKWPNDVCGGDRKLCGILAETVETSIGPAAIIGIGINLRKESVREDLIQSATSVEEIVGGAPDNERVLSELLAALAERYEVLQGEGGYEHTIREWCANSSYAFDRRVRVSSNDQVFQGLTRGLERDGALRVELEGGKIQEFRAGDVTAVRASG